MSRRSSRSVTINPNVRCLRVYPVEGTRRTLDELKTVGLRLSRDQALHLARVLLAVTQEWSEVDITAYPSRPRATDGTYQVTVTSS
jgi:hypothetical protein